MRRAKIGDVVELNPTTPPEVRRAGDALATFLPMASVIETGHLVAQEQRRVADMLTGYSYFERGDVLLAKITPCFENGKAAHLTELVTEFGFGSTEFHVLRPGPTIDGRYLFHQVHSPIFRATRARMMRGAAGQRRVATDDVAHTAIPLPPLDEQRRIAAILDRVAKLVAELADRRAATRAITSSAFVALFGNAEGRRQWDVTPLGTLAADTTIGLVRSSADMGRGGPYPYVRMNAVGRDGALDLREVRRVDATGEEARSYSLRRGDLLFNTRNSEELVGKTALFDVDGSYLYNNNLMRIRLTDAVLPEYVWALLQTPELRAALNRRKSGTTSVFAIYLSNVVTLPIPVPPLALQRRFADVLRASRAFEMRAAEGVLDAQRLAAALSDRAFRGEL